MHPRHYTDKEYQELVDALQENSEKLLDGDGWTLVSAKYYLDLGVPETFVCPYWRWNESGDSYGGRGFQARALCEAIEDALPKDSHIVDGVRKEA